MTINFKEFEKRIISSLRDSKLIENFSLYEIGKTPDLEHVIKIFEEPPEIFFDDWGIYYISDQDDKIYCPKMLSSISERGEWLSSRLPSVGFDIDQNCNVRKADEAEALYCCLQVAHINKNKNDSNSRVRVILI